MIFDVFDKNRIYLSSIKTVALVLLTILCTGNIFAADNAQEKNIMPTRTSLASPLHIELPLKDTRIFNLTILPGYALWRYSWDAHPASADNNQIPPTSDSPLWKKTDSACFSAEGTQPVFWQGSHWFRMRLQYIPSTNAQATSNEFVLAFQVMGAVSCYLDGNKIASLGTPYTKEHGEKLASFGYYDIQFYHITLTPGTIHEFVCYYSFHQKSIYRPIGGFRSAPPLGMHVGLTSIEAMQEFQRTSEVFWFILQGVMGSVVIIGIIHLYLFWGGERERINVSVGLFAFFITLQSLSFFLLNKALGLPLWGILAANSLLAAASPATYFFVIVILREFSGRQIKVSLTFSAIACLILIIQALMRLEPHSIERKIIVPASGVLTLVLTVYITAKAISLARLKMPGAKLIAGSILLYLASYAIEMYYTVNAVFHFRRPWFASVALFCTYLPIPLALSLTISRRVLMLRLSLENQNELLEQRVEERTVELSEANKEIQRQMEIQTEQAREIELTNSALQENIEQLNALNHEKNEIMGIVAHDLKNPIGAVRGFGDIIQNGFVSQEKDVQEVAGHIVKTADRMLELVKNLLDVSRLEQGGVQFTMITFDVAPLITGVIEQYKVQAEEKNISLQFDKTATEKYIVLADEQALMQVLDNLISNAVKYSPHGKNVFVRLELSPETVRVEVQDEGPGISADDMKKLFGKFARLSARPTGGEHSTGLGLSIVKKMVEAMNGKVWCESELGKGATFIVELPRR